MTIQHTASSFPYIHLRVSLECQKNGRLHPHKTSMLRGIIGRQLKKNVCHNFQLPCQNCAFSNSCIYAALFESPEQLTSKLGRGGTVPHPYIIRCHNEKTNFSAGDLLEFDMILLGNHALTFATHLFHVFEKIENYPFGKEKVIFSSVKVEQVINDEKKMIMDKWTVNKPEVSVFTAGEIPSYSKLLIQFITPCRIMRKGKELYSLTLTDFLWQVNHRVTQLQILNNNIEAAANTLPVPEDSTMNVMHLERAEVIRYSLRQNQAIKLGGIKAMLEITKTEELDQWLPLLLFTEKFHMGKATTFGLGEFKIWFKP